jgi:hypothetical protein
MVLPFIAIACRIELARIGRVDLPIPEYHIHVTILDGPGVGKPKTGGDADDDEYHLNSLDHPPLPLVDFRSHGSTR